MNKVKIYLLTYFLFSYSWAFATDDKPGEAKKNSGLISNVNLNTQNSLQLSLLEINEKLEQSTLKADLMTDLKEKLSLATIADRGKAQGTFDYLDQSPESRYKEDVSFNDLLVLPVGIRKKLSDNTTADLGILSARFEKDFAYLELFVRLTTQVNDPNSSGSTKSLFFGIKNVKYSKCIGLTGTFTPALLGDYFLNFGNWTVKLKGNYTSDYSDAEAYLNHPNGKIGVDPISGIKYTWHHHESCEYMILVPTFINSGVGHLGGAAIVKYTNPSIGISAGGLTGFFKDPWGK
jgi:hypothetical protein